MAVLLMAAVFPKVWPIYWLRLFLKGMPMANNTLTGDSMVMVNTENQTILTMEILQLFHIFKLFLANVVPCSSTNVLVVFSEFEPVNPIFGEDETQTPVKDGNTNLLGKMGTLMSWEDGTPTSGEDGNSSFEELGQRTRPVL